MVEKRRTQYKSREDKYNINEMNTE